MRAEREPQPDVVRPLRDQIRHHAEQANTGEQQRHAGEAGKEVDAEPPRAERLVEQFGYGRCRELHVRIVARTAARTAGTCDDGSSALRNTMFIVFQPVKTFADSVHHRARIRVQAQTPDIAGDADDGDRIELKLEIWMVRPSASSSG